MKKRNPIVEDLDHQNIKKELLSQKKEKAVLNVKKNSLKFIVFFNRF